MKETQPTHTEPEVPTLCFGDAKAAETENSPTTISHETEQFEAAVQNQLEQRAARVGGSAWGVKQGKPRVYLPSRRDIKVFVEYSDYPTGDEADLLGGPRLRVFVDECGQHPNWYKAQRDKAFRESRRAGIALAILAHGDTELAKELMYSKAELTDAMLDESSRHFINGRFDEARKVLGL